MSIVFKNLAILTLNVVESYAVITMGQGNFTISVPSVRCVYFCDSGFLTPATPCAMSLFSTVRVSFKVGVLADNIV